MQPETRKVELSAEAAKVVTSNFEQSVRADAPAAPGTRPLKDIKTVSVSIDELISDGPVVKAKWRELFGN